MGVLERLHTNQQALMNWWQSPLLGSGLGSLLENQKTVGTLKQITIHNTYLWLLAETGIIGLITLLYLPWSIFRSAYHQFKIQTFKNPDVLAILGLLVAASIGAMLNEFMYQRHLWLLFGLYLGSCRAVSVLTEEMPLSKVA